MIIETLPEIESLSLEQKLQLADELWDRVAAELEQIPPTPEQIAELERRMEEYRKDPTNVTTWEAIQQRILGRTLRGE